MRAARPVSTSGERVGRDPDPDGRGGTGPSRASRPTDGRVPTDETLHRLTGRTELLGLLATPIRHSRSPRMHNLAIAALGLDLAYLAFEVDAAGLPAAIAGLRALGARGWNVSMPNKVAVIDHLDALDESVLLTGACNTVVHADGALTGYNTDGAGWTAALREHGIDLAGATITIIGAGGAATAMIARAAVDGAARIHAFNRRDRHRAAGEDAAARIGAATGAVVTMGDLEDEVAFAAAVAASSVLANSTGVGMHPLQGLSPLPDPAVLRPDLFVSDVVYEPLRSRLLEQADAAGCRSMNGLPMMLHQGAASFRLFTGHAMPLDVVRAHLFD